MPSHKSATNAPDSEPDATTPAAAATDVQTLVGRLTADPILRYTPNGKAVAHLRIAVNKPDQEPTFHSVVVWKRTAEVVCQYLKKGRLVEVAGRTQQRTWTDTEGNDRTTVEISAYRVQFLNGRPGVGTPDADDNVAS